MGLPAPLVLEEIPAVSVNALKGTFVALTSVGITIMIVVLIVTVDETMEMKW